MTVIIYSTSACPFCKTLKDYLTLKNIEFIEKLIDMDESALKEMGEASGGFFGVPFIVITKDDGTRETVIGFDKGKLEKILFNQ